MPRVKRSPMDITETVLFVLTKIPPKVSPPLTLAAPAGTASAFPSVPICRSVARRLQRF